MVKRAYQFPLTFMLIIFSSNAAKKKYERRKMADGPRIAQNAKLKKPSGTPGIFARHSKSFTQFSFV